jgi:DNA-binding winged helix-turn-helix (wHTH) protein
MPETTADRPILIVRSDKMNDQQWTLLKDEVTIGRGEECDIVVPERQVSRQHARIYLEEDAYYIQDLDSRNGTWVNRQPLKGTRRLYDNDLIQIAMVVELVFIGSGATAPLPFEVPLSLTEGRLKLDREARRVFVKDIEIDPPLSPPQYRLLELLYLHSGRICTRDQVVEAVWPGTVSEGVSEQAIDALVRRLRDRIGEIDLDWNYILTVRGHGFRLENPVDER